MKMAKRLSVVLIFLGLVFELAAAQFTPVQN